MVSKRKTSKFPLGFPPVRFALDIKAMRVPLSLITGLILLADDVLVTWVKVLLVMSKRKISRLASAFPPVRFPLAEKAIRVAAALIATRRFGGPADPAPVVT